MDTKAINPTTAPIAPSDPMQPVQRTQVFSEESSLQSCGSVSSCFNWIYSCFASIWNALFGPAVQETWEKLCNQPEELAKEVLKKPDFQAAYVQLFDQYAKLDANLKPCEEMIGFTKALGTQLKQKDPADFNSLPFQIRINFFGDRAEFPILEEGVPHLVSIAKDNAAMLVVKFPEAYDLLLGSIPANSEKLNAYRAETVRLLEKMPEVLSSAKREEFDRILLQLYPNLTCYFVMSHICKMPIDLPNIDNSILDTVAVGVLLSEQQQSSFQEFQQKIGDRVRLFTSQPSLFGTYIAERARLLENQPPPSLLLGFGSKFIRRTDVIPTLLYRAHHTDLTSSIQKILSVKGIEKSENEIYTAICKEVVNPNTRRVFATSSEFSTFISGQNRSQKPEPITLFGVTICFWKVKFGNGSEWMTPDEQSLPDAFIMGFEQENNKDRAPYYAPLIIVKK